VVAPGFSRLGAIDSRFHFFWAHMIQPVYVVKPFDPLAAVVLTVITGLIGYGFGFFGAIVWNRFRRQ
jgi:hypothetical protein